MISAFSRNALVAFAVIFLTATPARAVPPAAMNKTVVVSYTGYQPGIGAAGSQTSPRNVTFKIYISSQGRLFTKTEARARGSGRGPGVSKERELEPSSSNFGFAGNTIVGTRVGAGNSVTRVTITFDASYQSCNANVIVASPVGTTRSWNSLRGERMTATGPLTISGISCSISQGNAFANG